MFPIHTRPTHRPIYMQCTDPGLTLFPFFVAVPIIHLFNPFAVFPTRVLLTHTCIAQTRVQCSSLYVAVPQLYTCSTPFAVFPTRVLLTHTCIAQTRVQCSSLYVAVPQLYTCSTFPSHTTSTTTHTAVDNEWCREFTKVTVNLNDNNNG